MLKERGIFLLDSHLYILSDDEIKNGDCVVSAESGFLQILSVVDSIDVMVQNNTIQITTQGANSSQCKKIIATTDGKIYFSPKIPQSYVDYYMEYYNNGIIFKGVMVEYENDQPKIKDDCIVIQPKM